ncbi:NAD-P-binding protein [Poronia punctata]|nr:NAD-P-binding protein [Poronia punctata]
MSSNPSYPAKAPETGANFTAIIHGDTYDAISPTKHADLRVRVVFISGASQGVGRATALSCVAAGCRDLALAALEGIDDALVEELKAAANSTASRDDSQSNQGKGGDRPLKLLTFKLDIRNAEDVASVAAETAKAFRRLDILVNNAGYLDQPAPIAASDPDEYWRPFEVNVRGTYLMTRAPLPLLLPDQDNLGGERENGHVPGRSSGDTADFGLRTLINVSSMGALSLRPGGSAYQTSKWALLKFTEFIMTEYADKGVLAYCVHPGGILTQLALNMPADTHAGLTDKPELAADTVVFLAHRRREWLAGRYVSCKWDIPELVSREQEIVQGDKLKVRLVV